MLQRTNAKSQDCYRHSAKARLRAVQSDDPEERNDFLAMAERWLKMGRQYENAEWRFGHRASRKRA